MQCLEAFPGRKTIASDSETPVEEVPLLLSTGQMVALERAARQRGLTTGQLLRHLVKDFLRQAAPHRFRPKG